MARTACRGFTAAALRLVCDAAVAALALATLVNLAVEAVLGQPAGWFWVDLRWMHPVVADLLLVSFAVTVLSSPRASAAAQALALFFAGICLVDAVRFYDLLGRGELSSALPIPTSLALSCLLLFWSSRRKRPSQSRGWKSRLGLLAVGGVVSTAGIVAFTLAFGATDYRRPADAIVVFGARVNPDGHPSLSLADRTRTACRLYHDGLASRIMLSGGHGAGAPVSEPNAMRALALSLGVPDEVLVLDDQGTNTLATVHNTAELAREYGWRSFLMVSHDYHLARIKLFSERSGISAVTVPADETRSLRRYPWFVFREAAALLYWYCHPATFD